MEIQEPSLLHFHLYRGYQLVIVPCTRMYLINFLYLSHYPNVMAFILFNNFLYIHKKANSIAGYNCFNSELW